MEMWSRSAVADGCPPAGSCSAGPCSVPGGLGAACQRGRFSDQPQARSSEEMPSFGKDAGLRVGLGCGFIQSERFTCWPARCSAFGAGLQAPTAVPLLSTKENLQSEKPLQGETEMLPSPLQTLGNKCRERWPCLSQHGTGRDTHGRFAAPFVSQLDALRLGGKLSPFTALCIFTSSFFCSFFFYALFLQFLSFIHLQNLVLSTCMEGRNE